jgi:DNA mismatch repair protein MutS
MHFHSYLNIPDTSGRDSLFQAEARRCKDIIDAIDAEHRHFCVFDELFSGTNSEEATVASFGFLKYLQQKPNVDFILTTHFTGLCKRIHKEKDCLRIKNMRMEATLIDQTDISFTYKLLPGINTIKAARIILIKMGFPHSILEGFAK